MLEFKTIHHVDEQLWKKAGFVYHQVFDKMGAKPDKVINNMFHKGICFLHLLMKDQVIIGMSITGKLQKTKILLIDYLAVQSEYQNQGYGNQLVEYIKQWSRDMQYDSIILEVEAEKTTKNHARICFWEKCGFTLTDYIHRYIWVPEPYQAMYVILEPHSHLPKSGEELFVLIGEFHKQSFQGA